MGSIGLDFFWSALRISVDFLWALTRLSLVLLQGRCGSLSACSRTTGSIQSVPAILQVVCSLFSYSSGIQCMVARILLMCQLGPCLGSHTSLSPYNTLCGIPLRSLFVPLSPPRLSFCGLRAQFLVCPLPFPRRGLPETQQFPFASSLRFECAEHVVRCTSFCFYFAF